MLPSEKIIMRKEARQRLREMESFLGEQWEKFSNPERPELVKDLDEKKTAIATGYAAVVSALEDLDR